MVTTGLLGSIHLDPGSFAQVCYRNNKTKQKELTTTIAIIGEISPSFPVSLYSSSKAGISLLTTIYAALAAGCISVEADVWLYNDTLYVGLPPIAVPEEYAVVNGISGRP